MTIKFNSSKSHSIGIELEVQLIDPQTFSLVPASSKIIERLNTKGYENAIKHELLTSQLEIISCVCSDLDEAKKDISSKLRAAIAEAYSQNILICCAGAHPFSHWKDQEITNDERYLYLLEKLQIIARRFSVCGLHVHIGVGGGEECIYIMNRLLYYLPFLLALSANSPFWHGLNTGLKSYRTKVFETLPTAGLPFYFKNWAEYSDLMEAFLSTKTITSIRDIWWDVRPHPDFGTIEIRICDAPSTIKEVLGIAALSQALVAKFSEDYKKGVSFQRPHSSNIRENKWRAVRYGLDGEFLDEDGKNTGRARDMISELIFSLTDKIEGLNSTKHISFAEDILKNGEGAIRQLNIWEKHDDFKEIVKQLSQNLRDEVG